MLDKNTVRINGYKGNKRTHVDFVVKDTTLKFYNDRNPVEITIPAIPHWNTITQIGFDMGLTSVNTYNAYNWVSNERITSSL